MSAYIAVLLLAWAGGYVLGWKVRMISRAFYAG